MTRLAALIAICLLPAGVFGQSVRLLRCTHERVEYVQSATLDEAVEFADRQFQVLVQDGATDVPEGVKKDAVEGLNESLVILWNHGYVGWDEVRLLSDTAHPNVYSWVNEDGILYLNMASEVFKDGTGGRYIFEVRHHTSGYRSTENPLETYLHEAAHLIRPVSGSFTPDEAAIARKVSARAAMKPAEFIAETFVGLIMNEQFPKNVLALYRKYNGPPAYSAQCTVVDPL